MSKDTTRRGEIKSSPPEIAKLPRVTCQRCGLNQVATIVDPETRICVRQGACTWRKKRDAETRAARAK